MEFAEVEVGKKYKIYFPDENKIKKVRGLILENDTEKQLLKFKNKKETYEASYDRILMVQPFNKKKLRVIVYIILALILLVSASAGFTYLGYRYYIDSSGINVYRIKSCNDDTFERCLNEGCDKPIIYLYPEQTTDVKVELGYPENTTHTYPKYDGSWQVLAEPEGNLTDLKTGRRYYALYWEGKNTISKLDFTEGFVVKGADTIAFLEEKLAQLGLTEREAEEFIVYWLPKMENAPYNYIRFQTLEAQNKNMPLTVTPAPQTMIRVLMEYKNLEQPIDITEQVLPPKPQRKGFTVVEWGGTEIR